MTPNALVDAAPSSRICVNVADEMKALRQIVCSGDFGGERTSSMLALLDWLFP